MTREMIQLSGRAHIKIDVKGRMSLPAQFRNHFLKSKSVIITNSVFQGHRILDFFSQSEWSRLLSKVAKWPSLMPEAQAYRRFYISSAQNCDIDGQARVIVPSHLRDFAQLEEDIVLLGMGNRMEIWSEAKWQESFQSLEKQFESILPILSDLEQDKSKRSGGRS